MPSRFHHGGKPHDQAGFTLVEMSITAVVSVVIVAVLFGALDSVTNAQGRVQALVNNQETVRLGLDLVQRDLRAANPVDAFSVTSSYSNEVQVELGPKGGSGSRTVIRWLYDTSPASPTYETLFRQVMSGPGPGATVSSQDPVVTRVRNVETGVPLFTYYDSHDNEVVAANPTTPANVADCAIRIHVDVKSDATPGPQPFSENIDVELRNRLPGGIVGCAS